MNGGSFDLQAARAKIDTIDHELIRLFLERLDVSREVALAKKAMGAPINVPAREREILTKISEQAGFDNEYAARLFFTTLFSISKARQRNILLGESALTSSLRASSEKFARAFPSRAMVACCGAEGSYAQQATCRLLAVPTIVYYNDFEKVFEAVENGECPYGVLPVENTAAGSVAAVYDLMQKHSFHIARACRLKIEHVLLAPRGVKLEDVREVASHPHALAQCKNFFKRHPEIKATAGANTALAAKEIASSGRRDAAVIASRVCADLYGLEVIADGIQDAAYNYTRFICISKELEIYPDANKFTIMLSLPHKSGALAAIITKFATIGVNLTKLESRPVPGMDFEFRFVFDFEASPNDPQVLALLSEMAQDPEIEHFEFLGAYVEN